MNYTSIICLLISAFCIGYVVGRVSMKQAYIEQHNKDIELVFLKTRELRIAENTILRLGQKNKELKEQLKNTADTVEGSTENKCETLPK